MMKTIRHTFWAMLMAVLALTSCLGDNEKTVYSDYCVISSFSLTTLKANRPIKGSQGQDSSYVASFSGVAFPMSIDQRNGTIENRDSLPYGTMLDKVLINCSFEYLLVHRPKDIAGLAPIDTVWETYSAKDTVDFTRPREFRVFAADGSWRSYTVTLNVHKTNPDATVWDSLGVSPLVRPAGCEERRMAVLGNQMVALMQDAEGRLTCARRPAQKVGEWQEEPVTGAEGADLRTMQQAAGVLYMSTREGAVLTSTTGLAWNSRMAGMPGLRLVGVSPRCLYGMKDGQLLRTNLDSEDWQVEALDDEAGLLPARDLTMVHMTQSNGNERLLLTGKTADGGQLRQWTKIWQGDETRQQAVWAYHGDNHAVKNCLPVMQQTSILPYNGELLAFGGAAEDGSEEAFTTFYRSQDYGVIWQKNSLMTLDERVTAQARDAAFLTAALQGEEYIWILVGENLWRCRWNKVLF